MKKIVACLFAVSLSCVGSMAGTGFYSQTSDPLISWQVTNNYSLWLQNNYPTSIRVKYTFCNDNAAPPLPACVGPLYTPWMKSGEDQVVHNLPGLTVTRVEASVSEKGS